MWLVAPIVSRVFPCAFPLQVAQRLSSMERSAAGVGARATGNAGLERDRIRVAILDEAAVVRVRPSLESPMTSVALEGNSQQEV